MSWDAYDARRERYGEWLSQQPREEDVDDVTPDERERATELEELKDDGEGYDLVDDDVDIIDLGSEDTTVTTWCAHCMAKLEGGALCETAECVARRANGS